MLKTRDFSVVIHLGSSVSVKAPLMTPGCGAFWVLASPAVGMPERAYDRAINRYATPLWYQRVEGRTAESPPPPMTALGSSGITSHFPPPFQTGGRWVP